MTSLFVQVRKGLNPLRLRIAVQWFFLVLCLVLGVRFGLFVRHFETFGATPYYARPPGVEGFLPIGALVSFKHWLLSGTIDPVHPAALVLFLIFLALALVTKNSFCSWICPVGTLEDLAARAGRRLFGRNFAVWTWPDRVLRGLKYLLLLAFVKLILIDMPAAAVQGFLASPYWAVADVKMLHFFTAPSTLSLLVIGLLTVLSVAYRNFWCRYLCPYGALLGLVSLLSLLKVHRQAAACTGCRRCTSVCPSMIPVHERQVVRSVECTGCLTCVGSCPAPGALEMRAGFWPRPLPGGVFALVVLVIFFGGIGLGMLGGHWESSLMLSDYRWLIPNASRLGH